MLCSTPSHHGLEFLRALWGLSFDVPWPGDVLVFADEFDLPARFDGERGRGPDWAVLWPDLVWIVELKSERGSHQHDQIPAYFALCRHHYAACQVWLTYLTPPATYAFEAPGDWARYAHVTWPDLKPTITSTWDSCTDPLQQACVYGLLEGIAELHLTQPQWKELRGVPTQLAARRPPPPPRVPSAPSLPDVDLTKFTNPLQAAVGLGEMTAADGRGRALEWELEDLEALYRLRAEVRDRFAATEVGSSLRNVMPWVWRSASTGAPMTAVGAATGFELRLSRYEKALY